MSHLSATCLPPFFTKVCIAVVFSFLLCVPVFGQLVHPGISHKRSDLDRMKLMVEAGVEPWASSFEVLRQHPRAQHDVVLGVIGQPASFRTEFSENSERFFINDGTTAYYNALMWYITGDERHAEKAIEVFNTYKGLRRNTTAIPLRSGRIWRIIEAAEIIKSTYDGWDPDDMQEFKDMLVYPGYSTTVPTQAINNDDFTFYWHIYNGDPKRHGNQGLFAMRTMMAMGIFLDNEVMYERALRYLRGEGHRSDDIPYPSGPPINRDPVAGCEFFDEFTHDGFRNTTEDYGYNEVIGNYIYENGQSQESSRDQAHGLAGVSTINNMSEMAWSQGDDLYGHLNNRPLLGMEFYLRYNLSYEFSFQDQTQPWEPTVDSGEYIVRTDRSGRYRSRLINPGVNCDQDDLTRGIDNLRPIYEMSLAHYKDRMSLPNDDFKWLQRGHDLYTEIVGVETEGVVTDHPVFGSLAFRRVSPGDPISGFDDDGLPQFAMTMLPGTIEAENFDYFPANGQGRTYSDTSSGNRGGAYRFDSDVDIQATDEGDFYIGSTAVGEFLTYTVNVPETGDYDIKARVSTRLDTAKIRFSFDGQDKTGEVAVPNTGGFTNFTDLTVAEDVPLTRGVHQVKVEILGGAFTLDNFEIAGLSQLNSVATGFDVDEVPVVSSNDLAQTAFLSSSANSNTELATEHAALFNGLVGNADGDSNDVGEVRMNEGDSFTINLDTITQPQGYDISKINSVFGWNTAAGGRSNQGFGIRFDLVDGTSQSIAPEHWAPNSPASFWTSVLFTQSEGMIASGVKSITFEISEDANARGIVIAREFDIFGSPSGQLFVLGDANGDGVVNNLDISGFSLALFNRPMYELMYPDSDPDDVLDMNDDGVFSNFDIGGFAAALGF